MKNISRPALVFTLLLLGAAQLFASETDRAVNQPARTSSTVSPAYPYLMRHAEAPAEVTVSFKVDFHGKVTQAKISNSSNFEFNEAALAAIRKWTFMPALKNGQAVETKLQQKFVFSVQDQRELNTRTLLAAQKGPR